MKTANKQKLKKMSKSFSIIDHTADIGLQCTGTTVEELFETTAEGMFSIIADSKTIIPSDVYTIEVQANSYEDLLHHWLNELLYLFSTKYYLYTHFSVRITKITADKIKLTGTFSGERINPNKHNIKTEIKTATYHQLSVKQTQTGWEGTVIFDI